MLRADRIIRILKAAGCWNPIEHDGLRLQTFGYSKHIGYAGVLVEYPDGRVDLISADLSKEESDFATQDVRPVVDRYRWVADGGNVALLHELAQ